MKKRLLALLLIFVFILSFAACGEHIPAAKPGDGGDTTPGGETPPNGGQEGGGDGTAFTISVLSGGVAYLPAGGTPIQVRLTDGKNAYTASLGADGKATFTGLDGDYTATLLNLPEGYTYDPNIYQVSNDKPTVSIDLLPLSNAYGNGTTYSPIKLNKTGIYRAEIPGNGKVVYYSFIPKQSGSYAIESIMDVSANMYNPILEKRQGYSVGANYYDGEVDGGGASGDYTTNFKYVVNVDDKFVGHEFMIFGVKAEGKDAVFPTHVDFTVTYLGKYEEVDTPSDLIIPSFIPNYHNPDGTEDYNKFLEWTEALRTYLEADRARFGTASYRSTAMRIDGKNVFDQQFYKLNPEDGFYHVYDEVKYALYGGWGPILYAEITSENKFLAGSSDFPSAFNIVEYNGNKALTLSEGKENYKLFIEGYQQLAHIYPGANGAYFCHSDCPCFIAFNNGQPNNNGGMCAIEDNCKKCKEGCRHISAVDRYQRGYSDICFFDGRAPVTEELKVFLQKYSESQRLFSDGNGWVENYDPRHDAYEDSQWLFACGFYIG